MGLKLIAFHGDVKIKKKYLDRVVAHRKADQIIHGTYWQNGRGCAVGCTVETGRGAHEAMEAELGIPKAIAYLEDRIFEGLENGESMTFPERFLKAINVGADLSLVTSKFMIWLLGDEKDGVIQYAKEDGKKAIQTVIDLYTRKLNGEEIKGNEWITARGAAADAYAVAYAAADAAADAAYAAAADAAYAAAYAADAAAAAADAAAADAAYAAAYAAAADAADAAADAADAAAAAAADAAAAAAAAAADAAYAAAAAAAARRKYFKKMADKLVELLKETK